MEKILIADNNRDGVARLAGLLPGRYEIVAAGCGRQAVELAAEKKPALILLASTLADPDGVSGINPVILNTVTWTELVPNPAGRKLYVVPGSDRNIKITKPGDMELARLFLAGEKSARASS